MASHTLGRQSAQARALPPAARVAALAGDAAAAERVGAEVDARFAAIDAWLGEAAESEDE